jgi:hypothetical protein
VIDERRQNVIQMLRDRSTRLAGMYQMALSTLNAPAEDGCESARISVVCHCMRELMNGLPMVMADSVIERPTPSSGSLTKQLPELLARHGEVDLGVDQDMIPVPKVVARHLESLIGTITREQGRNRSNAAALVTGGDNQKHPAIKQWKDAYDFFLGWTHLDRNHDGGRALPSDTAVLTHIRVIEDVIEVRTAVFFENVKFVKDLLTQINAPVREDV